MLCTFGVLSLDLMAMAGVGLGRVRSNFGFQRESFGVLEAVEVFRDPEGRAHELRLAFGDRYVFLEWWKSRCGQSKMWESKVGRQGAEEGRKVEAGERIEIV